MDATKAKEILDKVVGAVFGYQNPLTLDQALQKFAFDRRLPQMVYDSTTGQPTWASSINPSQFITMTNASAEAKGSDFMLPKRPLNSVECIRVEDSQLCSNSFNVIWSAKISNSYFIQDCYDLMDCMFCSHISGKRFCIANIQFTEEEYNKLKLPVIQWILTS